MNRHAFPPTTTAKVVALGDILTLVNGRAYSQDELLNAGTPVIRIQNLNGGDRWYYSDLSLGPEKYCERGDLLFAWSGTFGPYIWDGPKAIFHYHIWKILPYPQLDQRYAYHLLRNITEAVKAAGRGISMVHMTKGGMEAWSVLLPPLDEQRRIAAILDKADALRQKRKRAIALLDSLTQSIFLEMFGGLLEDGDGSQRLQLAEMIAAGDRLNYGVVQPGDQVDGGVPLVRVSDLRDGVVDHAELKSISPAIHAEYKRSILNGSEILVSCVGSIGGVALASGKERGFNIARAVARIPIDPKYSRVYVAEFLRTDHVQRYFTKESRTVSQPTLNIKQIAETLVPQPSGDLVFAFEERVSVVSTLKAELSAASQRQNFLFASLQHRAFSGQL